MSWLDLAKRSGDFPAFYYACIDARLAIEHLIFEQLVICTGGKLDTIKYRRCVKNPKELDKVLQQVMPEYTKLQEFTKIVASLTRGMPPVNPWPIGDLRKSWGRLSRYMHWNGASSDTTDDSTWRTQAIEEVISIVEPIWQKVITGRSGAIQLESMPRPIWEIWDNFRSGKINSTSARIQLDLAKSVIPAGDGWQRD